MRSRALLNWRAESMPELDAIEWAFGVRGLSAAGRRQVARGYVVLLASHFQRFCRELHGECIDHLATDPALGSLGPVFRRRLTEGRKLDAGNPTPGNIGSDFGRFGIGFWDDVRREDAGNGERQRKVEALMRWRNAFAHQDFTSPALEGRTGVRLVEIRGWRCACDRLVDSFDRVMRTYLRTLTGMAPW
jgi:hypothetical protein